MDLIVNHSENMYLNDDLFYIDMICENICLNDVLFYINMIGENICLNDVLFEKVICAVNMLMECLVKCWCLSL